MTSPPASPGPSLFSQARKRVGRWPLPLAILAGLGAMVAVWAGGLYAYRTYDFIEHDNEFCLSCHLMVDPYEQFGRSAHRGLGCKACHQPTMVNRSRMALSQILEQPTELDTHAEVPNERCASCHIEGDPEQWNLISNSAGHRVHLESTDSTLLGLQCVECHSNSVHQFTASDQTCGQSDCHTDNTIRLGSMADLTIHCAACHNFTTPVDESEPLSAVSEALSPDKNECLSCHAMRILVDLPDPDPHGGVCAACHNPHTQEEPSDAAETCANAGCHTESASTSAFHVGLEHEAMQDCMACHQAHDFGLRGGDCLACHQDVFADSLGGVLISDASGDSNAHPFPTAMGMLPASLDALRADTAFFRHAQHRSESCVSCHLTEESHGAVSVSTIDDCRSCHHDMDRFDDCAICHTEAPAREWLAPRTLDLSVGDPVTRNLPFNHTEHTSVNCASCHTEGLTLSAAGADCQSCHVEHHDPTVSCRACHTPSPQTEHTVEVHTGCGGAGCHQDVPFEGVPKAREVCLTCHQDQEEHRVDEGPCQECHVLPSPSSTGGGET